MSPVVVVAVIFVLGIALVVLGLGMSRRAQRREGGATTTEAPPSRPPSAPPPSPPMPVADADTITVTFENALALFRDLRGMAETNALAMRPKTLMRRDLLANAARRYASQAEHGRISATFRVIFFTGWAPARPR